MAFDQAKADAICNRISEGESLRFAAAEQGISHATFLLWVSQSSALTDQYARAKEVGCDIEFEGLTELSDAAPERDKKGKVDPGWVTLQKLRIDTRKWTLARKAPKKYGERVTQEHTGTLEINQITRRIVDPKP